MHLAWVCSKAEDGDREILEHFKVREFACADGTDRVLIAPGLADILHEIRQHFHAPVNITSGYRTENHNKRWAEPERVRTWTAERRILW